MSTIKNYLKKQISIFHAKDYQKRNKTFITKSTSNKKYILWQIHGNKK